MEKLNIVSDRFNETLGLKHATNKRTCIFVLECTGNTYGENCSETCGNCLGGEQCNIVNGTCETGCAAGWLGQMCMTGKKKFTAW